MDEVYFQQHGSRCRLWIPPEVRDPVCRHAPTRKSLSFFGAVRLRDGKLVMSRPEGMFNAQTCWDFLRKLERHSRPSGREAVVIIDNARSHHASLHAPWREAAAPRFRLHFLPPYSPDLNPIERVWKLIRRRCLHNQYFPTLDCVVAPQLHPSASLRHHLTSAYIYDAVFSKEFFWSRRMVVWHVRLVFPEKSALEVLAGANLAGVRLRLSEEVMLYLFP